MRCPYVSVENPLYMYEFYKVVDNRDRDISTQYDSIVDSNAQTMEKIFSEELLGQKEDKQLRKYYIKLRNQSISTDRLIENNKELADELNNTDYFYIELLNRLFSSFWDQAAKNLQDDFDKSKANKGKKSKKKNRKNQRKNKKTNHRLGTAVLKETQPIHKAPTTGFKKQQSLHDNVHNKNIILFKEAFSAPPDLENEEWVRISNNEEVRELDPHNKSILQFVCDSRCATGIIPPGPNSDIKPLTDFENPLLKKITIYPSRERGTGETIDEHIRNNHPELYEKICVSCENSLDAINAIGQEMIKMLNSIDSVSIERKKAYKPEYGISFVFPKLIIDGKLFGEPYRLVFARPKKQYLGPENNNNYRILVPRSLHKLERQPRVDEKKPQ